MVDAKPFNVESFRIVVMMTFYTALAFACVHLALVWLDQLSRFERSVYGVSGVVFFRVLLSVSSSLFDMFQLTIFSATVLAFYFTAALFAFFCAVAFFHLLPVAFFTLGTITTLYTFVFHKVDEWFKFVAFPTQSDADSGHLISPIGHGLQSAKLGRKTNRKPGRIFFELPSSQSSIFCRWSNVKGIV